MDHLTELESQSIFIIREAYAKFRNMALLWSIGKDSTALLWLCRKAFFGKIPFPVLHLDTSYKFKEIYEFRDKYAKEWGLDLIVSKNEEALKYGVGPCQSQDVVFSDPRPMSSTEDRPLSRRRAPRGSSETTPRGPHDFSKIDCCNKLKTDALKMAIVEHKFQALLLAIRADEHGIRAKERVFSPRDENFTWDYKNQAAEMWGLYKNRAQNEQHFRVHPLLDWRELDVWEYVRREKIPMVDLYMAGSTSSPQGKIGKRYRSIGCEPCCAPVDSNADTIDKIIAELKTTKVSERSGRAQDKENEYAMQKLRSLGYM